MIYNLLSFQSDKSYLFPYYVEKRKSFYLPNGGIKIEHVFLFKIFLLFESTI